MLISTQTPSKEDMVGICYLDTANMSQRLCTPQQAAELAQQVAPFPDQEWMVVLYLNSAHEILQPPHGPILGIRCSYLINPHPYFTRGAKLGASSLVTVRYHPHARDYVTQTSLQAFLVWDAAGHEANIRMYDAIVLDSEEKLFSFRGKRCWDNRQVIDQH